MLGLKDILELIREISDEKCTSNRRNEIQVTFLEAAEEKARGMILCQSSIEQELAAKIVHGILYKVFSVYNGMNRWEWFRQDLVLMVVLCGKKEAEKEVRNLSDSYHAESY